MDSGSRKRRLVSDEVPSKHSGSESDFFEIPAAEWSSTAQKPKASGEDGQSPLRRSISPPPSRPSHKKTCNSKSAKEPDLGLPLPANDDQASSNLYLKPSPIQLSTVNGLPPSNNVDTVSLGDILGDPLIRECWLFNYLFDVDYIMSQLDEDTRDLVRVKIVHGSWKTEDANRIRIEEAARKYANIQVITAYMGEMYGTHHSKMIILSRHDDQAEVIIVTGNFILRDWSMCQAVWRSGLLPLLTASLEPRDHSEAFPIGSGARFKEDILAYLRAYGSKRTGALTAELDKYDFCSIRAALIASVPGKQKVRSIDPETETLWGWPRVRQILSSIGSISEGARPRIVMQCSSVASLNENWVGNFKTALAVTKGSITSRPNKTPNVSLIFPTADEIRRSVDGYASGGSIHMKTQSAAQIKQLAHLRPMLCHWAGDADSNLASVNGPDKFPVRQALRRRAAPHIKTYIRFSDEEMKRIDWAMMTSANLSKQAWGEAITTGGEVRICSYEIGVVVWPALWDEGGGAEMVPVFGKDMPEYGGGGKANVDDNNEWQPARTEQKEDDDEETTDEEGGKGLREQKTKEPAKRKIIVGLRMPYDLPVVPYRQDEMPWCASMPCAEPDWMGRTWPAFDNS